MQGLYFHSLIPKRTVQQPAAELSVCLWLQYIFIKTWHLKDSSICKQKQLGLRILSKLEMHIVVVAAGLLL